MDVKRIIKHVRAHPVSEKTKNIEIGLIKSLKNEEVRINYRITK
jgi:hypothetical protein